MRRIEPAKELKKSRKATSYQSIIMAGARDYSESENKSENNTDAVEAIRSDGQSKRPASVNTAKKPVIASTYVVRGGMLLEIPSDVMIEGMKSAANRNTPARVRLRAMHTLVLAVGYALISWNIIFSFNLLRFFE